MAEKWQIEGEYFESCNCEVLCPCLLSRAEARPTEGHCDVVMAFHIARGTYGKIELGGLNAVAAFYTPGPMSAGNWTAALYVDERGSAEQRQALEQILLGKAGSPLSRFSPLIAKQLPTKSVPITFISEGRVRKLTIPNIADITVEGIVGVRDEVVFLDNVAHPAARRLAAARAGESHFKDHSLSFTNSARNGHFAPIKWSGTAP
jgi:hypothetical protein